MFIRKVNQSSFANQVVKRSAVNKIVDVLENNLIPESRLQKGNCVPYMIINKCQEIDNMYAFEYAFKNFLLGNYNPRYVDLQYYLATGVSRKQVPSPECFHDNQSFGQSIFSRIWYKCGDTHNHPSIVVLMEKGEHTMGYIRQFESPHRFDQAVRNLTNHT